jgi:hypothetical protein
MKITIEPYSGGTFTAQTDAEHIGQICEIIKGLLVQVGYHPHNVDEYIQTGDQWFPEPGEAGPEGSTPPTITKLEQHKEGMKRDYFENEEEYMN